MKNLKNISKNLSIIKTYGNTDVSINNINFDSRKVEKDDLFIAQKGHYVGG